MFLSNLSIRQPVLATMMMVAIAVLGVSSYQQLRVDMFPDVEFPVVTISTPYAGASPETVERDVTRPIEEGINTVEGVRHIESVSQQGLSSIVVLFNLEVSAQDAAQDIRSKVAVLRGRLPRDIAEPIVQRIDPATMPMMSVAVDAPALTPLQASRVAEKLIKPRLENVAGVGAVNLAGESEREIHVVVDPGRLSAYHLSLADVVAGVQAENVELPAGAARQGATEALVRVAARGRSAADIARLPLARRSGNAVTLGDVAQVVDGTRERQNLAFLDRTPALALDIQKQSGANTVAVADGVRSMLERIAPELPSGVSLKLVRDDSGFIRESLHDVNTTILVGGILTVLIVFLFLESWRSTVITGVTLPISVLGAFVAMRALGFTLNVLTLMGLSLAIGMLIDDAIVVRENIVRHVQRGKGHLDAARDGTAEIGLAVMATTFTIVAVFVPVAFMGGLVGRFFYEFGITVAAAVLVSLFVSFTLDPMLSSRWHDPHGEPRTLLGRTGRRFNGWFDQQHLRYERILSWSLRHRIVVLAVALVAFLGSFPILGMLGGDFMPDFNRGEYMVVFKATPGATLEETGSRARAMVDRLLRLPDVDYTYTTIGTSGDNYRPVTEGVTFVKLKSARGKTFTQVLSEARAAIRAVPGLTYGLLEAGPFGQKPIQISVRGPDAGELDRLARMLMAKLATIPGVVDLETSYERAKPEVAVHVDRARASDLGVSAAVVGTTLRTAIEGEVATVIEDELGDTHDVRVRLPAEMRRSAGELLDLRLPTDHDDPAGGKVLVPLREIAEARAATGPSSFRRKDLAREIRVSGAPSGRSLGEIDGDIGAAVADLKLPAGYDVLHGGDAEELKDMFANMFRALFLAIVFIYLILASQFGSFTHPLSIMLSLPLSLVGVALALLATSETLNIMSMIGLIMLMGLVTKNAILLVDFANHARAEGLPRDAALVRAGATRLRPIVMTTLAMIFGMLPLAMGIGAGAEMRAPMARAVIGGLITSTLLTLVVVPVVYTYLDGLATTVLGWLRRPPRPEEPLATAAGSR